MLKIEFSGNLPTFSSDSIACVQDYMNQAGNALILCETAQENIISSVVNDCKFTCKEDVLDMFTFAGLIPCNAVNPVSIYNALKKAIKDGKRDAADYSPITYVYIKDKQKQTSSIDYPAYLVLFRLFNRLKKRESDMKARQTAALDKVSGLLDAFSRGENVGQELALSLEQCEKLSVDGDICNEARKALLHKSVLRRANAIFHDLVVLSADISLNADVHHTDILACIFRGKGYVNKADEREKIFTSLQKYSKPAKCSYRERRRENNKAFYDRLQKAFADYTAMLEKEKRERLQKERDAAAANVALLQTLQNSIKQIAAICADVPASGKGVKKDDMLAKIAAIAKIASIVP